MTREEFEALPKILVRGTEYRVLFGTESVSVLEPDEADEVFCLRGHTWSLDQVREAFFRSLRAFDQGKAAGREELQGELRKLLGAASQECS